MHKNDRRSAHGIARLKRIGVGAVLGGLLVAVLGNGLAPRHTDAGSGPVSVVTATGLNGQRAGGLAEVADGPGHMPMHAADVLRATPPGNQGGGPPPSLAPVMEASFVAAASGLQAGTSVSPPLTHRESSGESALPPLVVVHHRAGSGAAREAAELIAEELQRAGLGPVLLRPEPRMPALRAIRYVRPDDASAGQVVAETLRARWPHRWTIEASTRVAAANEPPNRLEVWIPH